MMNASTENSSFTEYYIDFVNSHLKIIDLLSRVDDYELTRRYLLNTKLQEVLIGLIFS